MVVTNNLQNMSNDSLASRAYGALPKWVTGSPSSSSESKPSLAQQVLVELAITVVSAGLSYYILQAITGGVGGFKRPGASSSDPKRNAKSQAKRLSSRSASKTEPVSFDTYEDQIAGDMIFPEDIDVTFLDIGGHDQDKREIFNLIALPLKHPEMLKQMSELLAPPKGILLFGPPGTGKTMMAKAIAKESGAAFINLKMSTTMDLFFGESQKLVRATFSLAKKLSPCIIFVDEIDAFLRERKSDDNSALGNMKAEFMSLWDGMESNGTVVVVGATNRPWDVDPAILRRMPRTFEMSLPTQLERYKVISLVLRSEEIENREWALQELARLCEGYSGSDLKEMCRAAVAVPYREYAQGFEQGASGNGAERKIRALTWDDFEFARRSVRPSGETAHQYHGKTGGRMAGNSASSSPSAHDSEAFLAGVQYGMSMFLQQQQQQPPPTAAAASMSGRDVD